MISRVPIITKISSCRTTKTPLIAPFQQTTLSVSDLRKAMCPTTRLLHFPLPQCSCFTRYLIFLLRFLNIPRSSFSFFRCVQNATTTFCSCPNVVGRFHVPHSLPPSSHPSHPSFPKTSNFVAFSFLVSRSRSTGGFFFFKRIIVFLLRFT